MRLKHREAETLFLEQKEQYTNLFRTKKSHEPGKREIKLSTGSDHIPFIGNVGGRYATNVSNWRLYRYCYRNLLSPYFLSIIGTWKILGVIAILIPKFPLLKEWAYAGFFFAMTGAAISHLTVRQPFIEVMPSLVLLVATVLSWYFRPTDRKLNIRK